MESLTMDEMKAQVALVKSMYNISVRTFQLARLGPSKKVMYAVKVDETFPSPDRISLESMRRSAHDKPLTLFKRLCWTFVVCAAGVGIRSSTRDDDAGYFSASFVSQWANAERCRDMFDEFDEIADALSDEQQMEVCNMLHVLLFKSSSISNETPSLAFTKASTKVHEYAGVGQPSKRARAREARLANQRTATGRKKKRVKTTGSPSPKRARAEEEEPPTPPTVEGHRWPDKVGAKGPNGLPRKVGGNKDGRKCRHLQEGRECPFTSCSFSHA